MPEKHPQQPAISTVARRLVEMAVRAGACDADALAIHERGESVRVRRGEIEAVEHEETQGAGLRVFVMQDCKPAFASASTSDVSDAGLRQLVEQTLGMARVATPDPNAVPPTGAEHPTAAELATWAERHKIVPPWHLEEARRAALECEEAALAFAPEIGNSEGAEADFGTTRVAYAAADGFAAEYGKAAAGLSVAVIAGRGEGMQRDYAWDRKRSASELRSPRKIGAEAAERALRRLGAGVAAGGAMPVVFEPRTAVSLLGHLAAAANGRAILQQRSFLADCRGERIFPDFVQISDDPDHSEGLGNRLFDGEGSRCRPLQLIRNGVLTAFMTDRYAAHRLRVAPSGHASRALAGDIGIAPSNLILQPGETAVADILCGIHRGLWVTELIGFGVNGVSGDYSRGAAGFLIEDGKIARPVQEITIAGNLKRMFADITHVGDDLTWFGSRAAPSVAVACMTVAGQT